MAIAAIATIPFAICAAAATYVTYGLATCFGFDAAKTVESYFPSVEDGLYTLRYKTDDAWRGHEITRAADELAPFGFLPKRAKPATTYREA